MMRAVAIRPHGTITRAEELDGRVVIAEVAVEQRGFHVLTAAGAFAMQQCKANCGPGVGASTDIPYAHLRNDGRTVGITEHIENGCVGCADHVEARTIAERSTLS